MTSLRGTQVMRLSEAEGEFFAHSFEAAVWLDQNFVVMGVNPACSAYFGCEAEAAIGSKVWDALPTLKGSPIEVHLRRAMKQRQPAEFQAPSPAHRGRTVRARIFPLGTGGLGVIFDNVGEQQVLEARLREELERSTIVISGANLATWDLDARTGKAKVNRHFCELYGLPQMETLDFEDWLQRLQPSDRDRVREAVREGIAGAEFREEFRILKGPDDEVRHLAARGRTVETAEGGLHFTGVVWDMTPEAIKHEHEQLMARESEHRGKNLLAMVQALVRLTPAGDPHAYVEGLSERIAALASLQAVVNHSAAEAATAAEVARHTLLPFDDTGRLTISGDSSPMTFEAAQGLNLLLHELATNAVKYGGLSGDGGSVRLHFQEDAGGLTVTWAETCPHPIDPPTRNGFGQRLVAAMARQLGGPLEMTWAPQGLTCQVHVAPKFLSRQYTQAAHF